MLTQLQAADARLTIQLTIELPRTPEAAVAFSTLLREVTALPGGPAIQVSAQEDLVVPSPRRPAPVATGLVISPESRQVFRGGHPLDLTRLEFDLLLYLAERPHRVHHRRTLMAEVWGIGEPIRSRTIDVHMRRLRQKLGPDHAVITTVRGVGYRLDGDGRVRVS
ncbi:DNA-binding response OmpR family regulator [Crossiella equi]|uniref:DNA-binding response OmpR family regulator n=1 Tax=Crossiella equi TaxID=130796 RepID=A0ABS5APP7_9PSEU|nr:winged helix-turn-helix domain-containing protein [Crossiella equi]MBP2478377.1 DNA-binding response OmpR family regulator [Crossiella equi]